MLSESIVEALRNKHVFITGGTGFFGKSILDGLVQNPLSETQFTILSRKPADFLLANPSFAILKNVTFIGGDMCDFEFPNIHVDYLIHAAVPSRTLCSEDKLSSEIVEGTKRIIDFSKKRGVERLMLTSSGAIYGIQPPTVSELSEDFPPQPSSAYGRAKRFAEELALDSGIFTLLPRCFTFVGPYLNLGGEYAVGNFIRDCLENVPIQIRGDGTPLRSYMYATDLVEWLWTILLKGEHARPYNVGSNEAISIRDLAYKVRERAGTDNPVHLQGTPDPGIPYSRYVPSIERAKRELGLNLLTPLDDAISRTLAWHRGGRTTSVR